MVIPIQLNTGCGKVASRVERKVVKMLGDFDKNALTVDDLGTCLSAQEGHFLNNQLGKNKLL